MAAWILRLMVLLALGSALPADDLAERLGHPKGARLLILHADDLGMCQAANQAAAEAFARGVLNSGSAMVPCPWFPALADACARDGGKPDVGVHLTLTSEWREYRWGPVLPLGEVPGLVDPHGFLWPEVAQVVEHATAAEVEAEIRAQVARARHFGLEPTHLDGHMGTVFARPDYLEAYVRVAAELGIVPMVPRPTPELLRSLELGDAPFDSAAGLRAIEALGIPLVDHLVLDLDGDSHEARKRSLLSRIAELEPGLTEIVFHPAVDGPELAAITRSHRKRGSDHELLLDPEIRDAIARSGCVLVTWRAIGEVWRLDRGR